MTEEEKRKEMFKRYINSQQQKLDDYYRIDEEFYKDNIEELELNIKLLKQLNDELSKKDKVIEEIKNKLEEHIKFCEQEAKGHLENNICHISLKFDKSLLEIIEKVEEEK